MTASRQSGRVHLERFPKRNVIVSGRIGIILRGFEYVFLRLCGRFRFELVELAFQFIHLAPVGAAELFFDIDRQRSWSADDLEGCHDGWDARGGQSRCSSFLSFRKPRGFAAEESLLHEGAWVQ